MTDDNTYKTRSRCPKCEDWAIEGEPHECPIVGGTTDKHENPAVTKKKDRK